MTVVAGDGKGNATMAQETLFEWWPGASRKTDPASSHEAELVVTQSGARGRQTAEVLRRLVAQPGATAGELAARWTGLDRVQVARRLNDLAHQGRARIAAQRRCEASGRTQQTWWPCVADPRQS